MIRFLLSAGLFLAATTAPAHASNDNNISGHWSFAARLNSDCSFGGTAYLEHLGDGKYKGELTARQSCGYLEEDFLVRQDCKANVFGNQVSVRCRIVEFVNGFDSATYYPDNFTLTIGTPARMHGALVSSGLAKPAEWTRSEGGIS